MKKAVDRPYVVSVALEPRGVELVQGAWRRWSGCGRDGIAFGGALGRYRKRVLKRQSIRKEIDIARVDMAG